MLISNDIGNIKVNNYLFAKVIYEAICNTNDELYLATDSLKILASKSKNKRLNAVSSNIFVDFYDNNIIISFNTIMQFGTSITNNSNKVLDYIINTLASVFNEYVINVKMKVVGVKSKDIAQRDLEFERRYEP